MTAIMSGYEVSDDHARKSSTWLLVWDDDRLETIEGFGSKESLIRRSDEVTAFGGRVMGLHHIEVTP